MLGSHRLENNRHKKHEEKLARKTKNLMLERKEVIISILEKLRIPRRKVIVYGNVLFQFSYRGMLISFCNKRNSLDGEMHCLPKNQKEREILREAHIIADGESQLAEKFRRKSHFKEFSFEGDLEIAVKRILKLAQKLSKTH